jgi:hypothetical protein
MGVQAWGQVYTPTGKRARSWRNWIMNLEQQRETMALNAARVRQLVTAVTPAQARWQPEPESWSILEVVNHLYDEEREDFRVRLDIILHQPERPWPPIDPPGWVTIRKYNERDLDESAANFLQERAASLAWLDGLNQPNWESQYNAPFGPIRAGDMLAAWVAHDLLHLRQLVELHWAYTQSQLEPYRTIYAGRW